MKPQGIQVGRQRPGEKATSRYKTLPWASWAAVYKSRPKSTSKLGQRSQVHDSMIAVTSPMSPVGAARGSRSAIAGASAGGGGAFSRAARHDRPPLLRFAGPSIPGPFQDDDLVLGGVALEEVHGRILPVLEDGVQGRRW